jgi:hypothetical protein
MRFGYWCNGLSPFSSILLLQRASPGGLNMNLLEYLLPSACAPCDEVKEVKVVHIPRSSLSAWAHAADQVREDEASSPHSAGPQFWSWSRMTRQWSHWLALGAA